MQHGLPRSGSGQLWAYGNADKADTGLGMAPGTSPGME
jgi:hypothetical protein